MKAVIVHLDAEPHAARGLLGARGRTADSSRRAVGRRRRVLAQLAELRREGHVRHVRSLWIAGAVALTADARPWPRSSARPDVRSIEADSVLPIQPADAVTGEPGIASHRARPASGPRAWTGAGSPSRALDTGVDLTHPELAARYRGGGNSWFDPYGQHAAPADLNGHGTQVMGVMVAGDGIGMAPGARSSPRAPSTTRAPAPTAPSTSPSSGCSTPTAIRPPTMLRTSSTLSWGAAAGLQPRIPARPAGAARRAHPAGRRRRQRGAIPRAAPPDNSPGQPSRGVRGRSDGERQPRSHRSRARALELRRRRSSPRSSPRARASAPPTSAASTRRSRGDVVLGPARRGRPRAAAPGRPAAQRGRAGDPAHAERADLGAPGPDSTFGAGSLDLVAAARLLHSPALDFDPPVLSGAAGTRHDAPGARR